MIKCALDNDQIEALYTDIATNMIKDKNFDPTNYMQSIFDMVKEDTDSAEQAAQFIQPIPQMIGMINFSKPGLNLNIDFNELNALSPKFLNVDTGVDVIIKEFSVDPKQVLIDAATNKEDNNNPVLTEEDPSEEPKKEIFRGQSDNPLTTTGQNLVKKKPNSNALEIQQLDPSQTTIVNTLANLKLSNILEGTGPQAFSYTDLSGQTKTLKLKLVRFDAFVTNSQTKDLLPTSVQQEAIESFTRLKRGNASKKVTQANERVIAVIADEFGQPVFFTEDGSYAESRNDGSVVFQFIRDVRTDKSGTKVTDIYGKEERIMSAQALSKRLGISVEEAKEYLDERADILSRIKKEFLGTENKKHSMLVDIQGITEGMSDELANPNISLDVLSKALNNSTNSNNDNNIKTVLQSIDISNNKTRNVKKAGMAYVTLNGNNFGLERYILTEELINEIAEVVSNPKFSKSQRKAFLDQFLNNNVSSTQRNYKINTDGTFQIIDQSGKKPIIIELSKDKLSNKAQRENAAQAVRTVLAKGYYWENASFNNNSTNLAPANWRPTVGIYNEAIVQETKPFLRLINGQLVPTDFREFLISMGSRINVKLNTLNPGFYNMSIAFKNPYSALNESLAKAKEVVDAQDLTEILETEEEVPWYTDEELKKIEEEKRKESASKEDQNKADDIDSNLETNPNQKVTNSSGRLLEIFKKEGDWSSLKREGYDPDNVTKKQIEDAVKWWSTSPLSKVIGLEKATNIVNSGQFAEFVVNASGLSDSKFLGAINIADKGTAVDIYHEAWHGFSQLYLDPKERKALYNEVRNSNTKYKDYSNYQIEEILAEEFRSYAKNPKIKKNRPKRNTIFRKILNFLKTLFGKAFKNSSKAANIDVMSIPRVNELYSRLYLSSSNPKLLSDYTPSVKNHEFLQLNRGIRQVDNRREDALNDADSKLIVSTMDSLFSELVDDISKEMAKAGEKSSKSATLNLILNPQNRKIVVEEVRERLKTILKTNTDKLAKETKMPSFDAIDSMKGIKENAVAILEAVDPETGERTPAADKYFFFRNQVDSFKNLNADIKRGERSFGENFYGIDIISDFYTHKNIKSGKNPTGIIVANNITEVIKQTNNLKSRAKKYGELKILENKLPEIEITRDQQDLLNKIRILETALGNWTTSNQGTLKYYYDNSTFPILNKNILEEEALEEDEQDSNDPSSEKFGKEIGKKSLVEMAEREVIYILKSLHKVDADGKTSKNYLGVKELADFKRVWATLNNRISGIKNPMKMYQEIEKASEEFPELKQLIKYKLPKPENTTNEFEFDAIASFWQTYKKSAIKYYQLSIFKDGNVEVTESDIDTDAILRDFQRMFKAKNANEYISIVESTNTPMLNLDTLVKRFDKKGLREEDYYEFLNTLGIELDNIQRIKTELTDVKNESKFGIPFIFQTVKDFNELESRDNLTEKQFEYLYKFIENPVETLVNDIPAGVLLSKNLKRGVSQSGSIKELAKLQSKYGSVSKNYGLLAADGERIFPHVLDSNMTMTLAGLNELSNLRNDTWQKTSSDKTESEYDFLSYLNPNINPFTERSHLLNSVYRVKEGTFDKRANKLFDLFITSGINIEDNKTNSKVTSDLTDLEKFTQDLHAFLLNGVKENTRPADKKASYGLKVQGGLMKNQGTDKNLYVDMDMFNEESEDPGVSEGMRYSVDELFIPAMAVEFDRIKMFDANKELYLRLAGYNRPIGNRYAGNTFTAFDNILKSSTKNELYKLQLDPAVKIENYLMTDEGSALNKKIRADIMEYIQDRVKNNITNYYNKAPYLSESLKEKSGVKNYNSPNAVVRKQLINTVMSAYTINNWIHNFEVVHLLHGNMVQFDHSKEHMQKRTPGGQSGGEGFLYDQNSMNFINEVWNKKSYASRLSKKGITPFQYTGKLNTAIIKDSEKDSEFIKEIKQALEADYKERFPKLSQREIDKLVNTDADTYLGMEESDGHGYITFDAYRTLKKLQNKWTNEQENLFQRIANGETINPRQINTYFPVYKLHHYGALDFNEAVVTSMHKFALSPIIPGSSSKQKEKLHEQMMKEGIQYITFESGNKVGGVSSNKEQNSDDIYTDDTQTEVKDLVEGEEMFTPNTIYMQNLKEVTKVNEKYKSKVTFPTQLRGILLDGLFNKGGSISAQARKAVSNYTNAVNKYNNILKDELLAQIDFKYDVEQDKYISKGDMKSLMKLLQNEMEQKNLPYNLLKLINTTPSGEKFIDLSIHPKSDDVMKALLGIIQKRLVKQKVYGEPLIQTPVTLDKDLWLSPGEENGTNGLQYYRKDPKTGKTLPAQAAIALQGDFINLLNLKHNDGEPIGNIDRLNEMIKDEVWLNKADHRESITILGPRIPIDATNSNEIFEVYHFLNPQEGNKIIVPTEIVAKAGSDFDVDKLFELYPRINREGNLVKTVLSKDDLQAEIEKGDESISRILARQKDALHNELVGSIKDVLLLKDNYVNLVRPNNIHLVKRAVETLESAEEGYDRFENVFGEERSNKKGDKTISPTRTLELGYNLYQHKVNLVGAITLGIVALKNKMHPIYKQINFQMPGIFTMKFDHNTTNGAISLAGKYNKEGENISEIFSHLLNAILDRAKDPFTFTLGATPESINVLNYMIEAGVPSDTVFTFLNQPLVKEYIQEIAKLNGPYSVLHPTSGKGSTEQRALSNVLSRIVDPKVAKEITARVNKLNKVTNSKAKRVGNLAKAIETSPDVVSELLFRDLGVTENLTQDRLEKGLKKDITSLESLAMLAQYYNIQRQTQGLREIQSISTPDTTFIKTAQQVNKQYSALQMIYDRRDLDPESVRKLLEQSILSGFNVNDIMYDITSEVFDLNFSEDVNSFVTGKLLGYRQNKALKARFGKGVDGEEVFTASFTNAISDYLLQNLLSRETDPKGNVVLYPEFSNTKDSTLPVNVSDTNKEAISLKDGIIYVNDTKLKDRFEKGRRRGFAFNITFDDYGTYVKYKLKEAFVKNKYSDKSKITNFRYKQFLKENKETAYNKFIAERSLMNSYNRSFIMGTSDISYSQLILDTINQFSLDKYFEITDNLSLASLPLENSEKILDLNNRDIVNNDADLADKYNNEIKQLANVSIPKVKDAETNADISDIFNLLSLNMIYQHGKGFSRLSFNSVVDTSAYISLMKTASENFLDTTNKNFLDGYSIAAELNDVYNRMLSSRSFQNYLTDTPAAPVIEKSFDSEINYQEQGEFENPPINDASNVLKRNIYELVPNFNNDVAFQNKLYNNYAALITKVPGRKEMTKEQFLDFVKRVSVYKFKDTYMFGNYDYDNAIFVNRVTSSPSSKQFLAEAIPTLVDSGLDFIHFVPKDVRDKYKRSGYTVSTRGFKHNLRGEEMTKYLATSNPNIVSKIFGKEQTGILNSKGDIGVLTGAELKEYNDSTFDIIYTVPKGEVINTPVNIDGASIKKAGKDTSKVLETYLKSFGIKVKDINEIKSKLTIDDIGFADILNKVAYVKDKDALPDVAGEFIAYMMQYNPLVKDIIRELAGTTDYKSIKDKDKYFKIVGKLINEDLRNKSKGEYSKSLLGKIAQLIKEFFKTLRKDVNIELINTNIGIITNNILQQNVDLITGNKYKPGEYGKPTKQVTIKEALETDKFGASIVKRLSKEGFILTGSTALAEQGTVLRPEENPLHDIDWVSPFTRTETKSKFLNVYPDAVFLREIENKKKGYITDTYMLPPAGYKITNFRTVIVQAKDGTNRVMLENYDVVNKKSGKVEGTYRIETTDYVGKDGETYTRSQEIMEGVEAKAIDFFTYEKYNQKKPFDYITKDGDVIQLANWIDVFTAKLEFVRLKDVWDYNRFIPNVVEEGAQPAAGIDITLKKEQLGINQNVLNIQSLGTGSLQTKVKIQTPDGGTVTIKPGTDSDLNFERTSPRGMYKRKNKDPYDVIELQDNFNEINEKENLIPQKLVDILIKEADFKGRKTTSVREERYLTDVQKKIFAIDDRTSGLSFSDPGPTKKYQEEILDPLSKFTDLFLKENYESEIKEQKRHINSIKKKGDELGKKQIPIREEYIAVYENAIAALDKTTQPTDKAIKKRGPLPGVSNEKLAEMPYENYVDLLITGYTEWLGKDGKAMDAAIDSRKKGTLGEINYTINRTLKNKDGSKRLAGTDGKVIKINPVESVDEFFDYFTGKVGGESSLQKQKILEVFDDFNISVDDMKQVLNTTDKINDYLVYHEQNHIDNNDIEVYWAKGRDLLTPDKIKIEFRASYEALRRVMNKEEKERLDISVDMASQYYADQGGYQVGNGPFIKFTGKTCT